MRAAICELVLHGDDHDRNESDEEGDANHHGNAAQNNQGRLVDAL